jgi:hypothetical protein
MAQIPELIKLSPSKLGAFLECPACFWRDYHGKSPPSFPPAGILNRMDRLTKEYYDKFRNKVPPILKGKVPEKLVDKETAEKLRSYMKYFDEKLNLELKGKMDDCFIDETGKLVPMDNKTASPGNEDMLKMYQLQLDAYTFLLQQNSFKTADYGYLVYYVADSGDPENGIVFRAEAKKLEMHPEKILKLIKDAADVLRKPSPPKSHGDCEMCDWIGKFEE